MNKRTRLLSTLISMILCFSLMTMTVSAETDIVIEDDLADDEDIIIEEDEPDEEDLSDENTAEDIGEGDDSESSDVVIDGKDEDPTEEDNVNEDVLDDENYDDWVVSYGEAYGQMYDESISEHTPKTLSVQSKGTFYTMEETAAAVREAMVNRETDIVVDYIMTEDPGSDAYTILINTNKEIFNMIMDHTGNGQEGDYLANSYYMISYGYTSSKTDKSYVGNNKMELDYECKWATTAEQEAAMTKKLDNIYDSFNWVHATGYEKIKDIYNYVTTNVAYNSDADLAHHAYGALMNGEAVCNGYSSLLYRMANDCGIDCRMVTGTASGGSHAWNIVKIGDYYYNCDSTFDKGGKTLYFLKGSNNFPSHTAGSKYTTDEFKSAYPISTTNFDPDTDTSDGITHTYGSWETVKKATCQTKGTERRTCKYCDAYEERQTALADHSYGNALTQESTCTQKGKTYQVCSVCGQELVLSELEMISHDYQLTESKDATSTTDGYKKYVCTICGASYTDTIPAYKSISDATVTLSKTSYTYDGSEKQPSVTVKIGSTTLTKNTDYTVSYSNNKNAGTATVTVTGKGNYTGTKSTTFTINAASISDASITLSSSSYTYNGSAKKPTVTVKNANGATLTSGTDYTVSYSNNTNAGTATATATGKGNYTGTVKKSFTINKASQTLTAKATKTTLVNGKTTTITASGKGTITYSSNKTSIATVSSKGKVTAKAPGKATITVKAAGNSNYKSASKTITIKVNPKATSLKSLKNTKGKKATVKWKKVSGVSGYQIQYSTSKSFKSGNKSSVIKGASKVSKTLSKLKKGKTYYVRVRTYKTVSGTKYYSSWSSAKKVKISK